ncbi:mitochondrial antiviral-signaling protein [Heptranchias perlo]|uniref:mitochondrial antiviral-signaling protein n=1 Tax=Heptranchias perlo TaxID=212740 RepID=UPI00355A7987
MSFVSDELYKYIRRRMSDFLIINTLELLPHLHCLTQMDQEKIKAEAKHEGNESAVPTLLDSVRRRQNWERQLINALRRNEYNHLADDLERKLESLAPRRPVANVGASAVPQAYSAAADSSTVDLIPPTRAPLAVSHPNNAAADSSTVHVVPPLRAPFAVSLPNNPSGSVTVPDNSESSPRGFPSAGYLPTQPSSYAAVQQPSAGKPAVQLLAPTANQQSSALLVAASSTSTASSSASLIPSDSTPQHKSKEFKKPIQEMGDLVDGEGNEDYKLPLQEKMVTSDQSKLSVSPQTPKNWTIKSDQNASGEKSKVDEIFTPSTDQAAGGTKTDQAIADVPSTSRQVHPHRPPYQSNDDDYQGIEKPEVLRSDAENMQPVSEAASNPPEFGCSVTSRDLQLSESTVDTSRSNSSDSSPPLTDLYPTHTPKQASPLMLDDSNSSGASVSGDFSDETLIKEQKIQALRGYQNDQLQRSFYDVHSPLNIQLNFDAQKKIAEGEAPDQEDILNQNLNIEHQSKAVPVQMSNTEVAQSVPAFRSTCPVENRAGCEVEFMKNVQVNNSIDTISSSDLMLSSSDSGCSFGDRSTNTDCVNEPSVHGEQGSQNANLQNNNSQLLTFQLLGVQVPAQIDDTDAVQENASNQNQTTEHECEPESNSFDWNQSHEDRFTEQESDKELSLKEAVSGRGSLHSYESEVSRGKCGVNPKVENTGVCNEDIKEHSVHIYQKPDYESKAVNDSEFKATNLGDFSGCGSGEGSINALSTEHVSSASQKRSEPKQPVNPNVDSLQPNYVLVSMAVLVSAVVAGCVWRCYRK